MSMVCNRWGLRSSRATFDRAPVSWLGREDPGAGITVGDEKQRPPPRLSYHATGADIMVVVMVRGEKQRLPPRLLCHASVNTSQRGEAENITFRRLFNEEKD